MPRAVQAALATAGVAVVDVGVLGDDNAAASMVRLGIETFTQLFNLMPCLDAFVAKSNY